jgi:hypothetical protein
MEARGTSKVHGHEQGWIAIKRAGAADRPLLREDFSRAHLTQRISEPTLARISVLPEPGAPVRIERFVIGSFGTQHLRLLAEVV